jgi:leucyl aminopeptidase
MKIISVLMLFLPLLSQAQKPVLADLNLLKVANIPVMYSDENLGVGFANLDEESESRLSMVNHANGKCGGFESLENSAYDLNSIKTSFENMRAQKKRNELYSAIQFRQIQFPPKPNVEKAIADLKIENLKTWVEWISSFPTRFNKVKEPNNHVVALVDKLKAQLAAAGVTDAQLDLIDHKSTKQKSIRLSLPGTTRPHEIIVLGAHFDSIVQFGGGKAPGSDDDASGSANLLEVLRVLLSMPRTERTVEFFWYAGEESGLLGSAEIAKDYKAQNKNVISVLQLDMTLFPGSGRNRIGLVQDFTSVWLNDIFKGLNDAYVKAEFIEDKCGYACSDHASWNRQGFPAATPFEATLQTMNKNIHTSQDVIDEKSDFEHSLQFSKLAMAYVLEMGNSTLSEKP